MTNTNVIDAMPDDGVALVGSVRVERINAEHKAAQQMQRNAVEHAVRCGQLLIGAQKSLARGEWGAWVQKNLRFSERSAQGYMRLASIDLQKRNAVADLSLREALKAIADQSTRQRRLERQAEREAKVHEGEVTHVEREAPPARTVGVIDDDVTTPAPHKPEPAPPAPAAQPHAADDDEVQAIIDQIENNVKGEALGKILFACVRELRKQMKGRAGSPPDKKFDAVLAALKGLFDRPAL